VSPLDQDSPPGPNRELPPELLDVEVDTRPLAMVLLSRSLRPFLLLAGAAIFFVILRATPPAGLSRAGESALAIFALCVVYWVTGALPLVITGLLAIVLLGICGVMTPRNAYSLFGSEAVFFVLAAFMLAAAVNYRGLGRRVAVTVFARYGHTPLGLLRSVYLLSALMSFLIPEHAVAAIVFPIVLNLVDSLEEPARRTRYPTALFLAMAWGTNIGGIATLLGGARGPLALGILTESTGVTISFLHWSLATLPLVAILLTVGYFVLVAFFASEPVNIERSIGVIGERKTRLGRITFQETAVAVILAVTVIAWSLASAKIGLAAIAILAVVALFVFGLLTWQEVEGHVNWGIILMYGGAISLGAALERSKAAAFIGQSISKQTNSPTVLLAILSLACQFLGETLSHSAVVASMLPVGLGLATHFGLDLRALTLAITLPAGLTYIMPVSTPANALAYSGGYLRTKELLVPGAILILSSWVGLNLVMHLYWPLIGLSPFAAHR
jgi:solute carrier family 13 (sodium-dependent dicarboxylate transporter), member 2/3/5